MTAPSILEAALAYAKLGWHVLPLWWPRPDGSCACEKGDCDKPGKHPLGDLVPHGVNDATTDAERIRSWWAARPEANVGIATGEKSGLDALDVDGEAGAATIATYEREHAELPRTVEGLTGGGGRHVFFKHRKGLKNVVRFAPGLDVRTTGGYVVAAPSLHRSGRRYEWEVANHPDEVAVADWPENLAAMVVAGAARATGSSAAPPSAAGPGAPIPENLRNTTLTSLAGSMRRRGHTESEIRAALLCTNAERCRPPLPQSEVESIARSVANYEPPSELLTAPLTDLGNRERLIACHGEDLRHHEALGWLAWTGTHWQIGSEHAAIERAADTVRLLYAEAAKVEDADRRQALAGHAIRSESAARIRAMVDLARTHPAIRTDPEKFDADAFLLCVENGVIDLRTGELRPHRRDDLITRHVPIDYDPDARAPRWEAFLSEVQPDAEVRAFLQRFAGYVLTADTGEQVFLIVHGPGSNGKTVFTTVIFKLAGGYAVSTPFSTFLQRPPSAPTNDLADLRGARLALASEPDEGVRLSESVVKQLTGGDLITCRRHYQEFQTFKPVCKVVLVGNHKPRIRGTDNAIWRRVHLVVFGVTIPKDRRDRDLPRKLKDELPGILAWAVQGCLAWQREGLRAPQAVQLATDKYRQEEDHVGRFLEDCCEIAEGLSVTPKALRQAYVSWCEREEEEPLSPRTVARRLSDRGLVSGKDGRKRVWKGVGLVATEGEARADCAGPPQASRAGSPNGQATSSGRTSPGPASPPNVTPPVAAPAGTVEDEAEAAV